MNKIFKALFKTGSASLIGIVFGVVTTKVIAVLTGPSGVGTYSLLRQLLMMGMTVGTFGGQTALIQGVASKDSEEKKRYISSVFYVFLLGAIIVSMAVFLWASEIVTLVFSTDSQEMITVVRWLCLPIVLMIFSIYLASILNGCMVIGRLAKGQIIGSFISVVLVYPLSLSVAKSHALAFVWLLSGSQMAMVAYYIFVIKKEKLLTHLLFSFPSINPDDFRSFIKIAGVTLFTGLMATGGLLVIRSMITKAFGLDGAGMFDVAWTISMTYVMFLLGALTTYYLPTLSAIQDETERALLIQVMLRLVVLILVPLILILIPIVPMIIHLMYSESFMSAIPTVRWMLIGDYFKVCSWVLSIPLVAFSNVKILFWSDLYWWCGFVVFAFIAISFFGNTDAIGFIFLLQYVGYFVFLLIYSIKKYKLIISKSLLNAWIIGFVLIIFASVCERNSVNVNISSIIWPIVALLFVKMVITKEEFAQIKSIFLRRKSSVN